MPSAVYFADAIFREFDRSIKDKQIEKVREVRCEFHRPNVGEVS